MGDANIRPPARWRRLKGLGIWLGFEFRSRLSLIRRGLASLR